MMEWNDFFQFIIATASTVSAITSVVLLIVTINNKKK